MSHFLVFDLDLRSKVKVIARGQGKSSRSNVGRVVVDIWARLAECSKSTMTHGIQSKISVCLSVIRGHSRSKTFAQRSGVFNLKILQDLLESQQVVQRPKSSKKKKKRTPPTGALSDEELWDTDLEIDGE